MCKNSCKKWILVIGLIILGDLDAKNSDYVYAAGSSFDGYYLAQHKGDVSRFPFRTGT